MPKNYEFRKISTNKAKEPERSEKRDPVLKAFYNSTAWRRVAKAYAADQGYVCEICRNKYARSDYDPFYKQFHVHHKVELTRENMRDPSVALNRDNLQLLCQHCHSRITFAGEVLEPGLIFDENGMVRKLERT